MTSPPHSTAARLMTCKSSRTLPGQRWLTRQAIASSETARAGVLPARARPKVGCRCDGRAAAGQRSDDRQAVVQIFAQGAARLAGVDRLCASQ